MQHFNDVGVAIARELEELTNLVNNSIRLLEFRLLKHFVESEIILNRRNSKTLHVNVRSWRTSSVSMGTVQSKENSIRDQPSKVATIERLKVWFIVHSTIIQRF